MLPNRTHGDARALRDLIGSRPEVSFFDQIDERRDDRFVRARGAFTPSISSVERALRKHVLSSYASSRFAANRDATTA